MLAAIIGFLIGLVLIIGFLIGLVLVWWIPTTTVGGAAILILIPIVFCTTVGGIVSALLGKKGQKSIGRKTRRPLLTETVFIDFHTIHPSYGALTMKGW
jgi:hypothetical protein